MSLQVHTWKSEDTVQWVDPSWHVSPQPSHLFTSPTPGRMRKRISRAKAIKLAGQDKARFNK